jgi:hypothetical protein
MYGGVLVDRDERYTDIPCEQLQDAIGVTLLTCRDQGIDIQDPGVKSRSLITDINWHRGVAISAPDLPYLASLTPEARSWFPTSPWLEALLEDYQYIIIIPAWLVDLRGAIRGNRAAASRSVGQINPRRLPALQLFRKKADELGVSEGEARLELMTDILLEVLTYRHEELVVWSASNPVQLKHPDGTIQATIPDQLNPSAFRQWAAVQTIENTELRLKEKPLHLDILINAPEGEGEPSQLWWYPDLPPLSRGGRPVGSHKYQNADQVLRWLKPYVDAILEHGGYPSLSAIAGQMGVHEDTIKHHTERFFPDWDWESFLRRLRSNLP